MKRGDVGIVLHGLAQLVALAGIVLAAWRHDAHAGLAWFIAFLWISIASSRAERIAILEAKAKIDRAARGDS